MNIRDIAAAANVSVSTVSKVLNQKDQDISEATRERVRAVIREYNYTPYSNIKENAASRSGMIALLIHPALIGKDFIPALEKNISKHGYSLIISALDPGSHSLAKYLNVLRAKHVEGVLLYAYDSRYIESYLHENTTNIPTVFLSTDTVSGQTTIHCDYSVIAYTATKLLLHHGHSRIACILDNTDSPEGTHAKTGYLRALFDESIPKDDSLVFALSGNAADTQAGFESLLEKEITAIYCQNGVLASSVYAFLHRMNISIPDEVSVTCGETSDLTKLLYPQITTVELPGDTIGGLATKVIIKMIEKNKNTTPRVHHVEPVVHKGDSIALPAINKPKIVVIGNMNMDVIISTDHIPVPGELIVSNNVFTTPGGKGINQAIGAGKLGGFVYAIGRLGNDMDGQIILDTLSTFNIKTEGIYIDSASSTGKAFINVSANTNSTVISYPGSNAFFDTEQLNRCTHLFTNTDYCLISTELSPDVIAHSVKRCQRANVRVFLKPSSTSKIDPPLLGKIDYLVPNQTELSQLVPGDDDIRSKADRLHQLGRNTIIVTLGGEGCYLKNDKYDCFFPAADFTPVDTTGAANCFISALAVALGEGNDLPYAICFATYAAGFSITQQGTQSSFPNRAQLDIYQDDINAMYSKFLIAH